METNQGKCADNIVSNIDLNDIAQRQHHIETLEEIELRDQDETHPTVLIELLLLYMVDNEPMKAKFLWKRIPNSVKEGESGATLHCAWSFIASLIQRKYAQAFALANEQRQQNQWLTAQVTSVYNHLVAESRERVLDLISVAYSSIGVADLANTLAIDADELKRQALDRHWTLDNTGLYLIPKRKQHNLVAEIPNQKQMEQLTSLISFLET